MIESGNIGIKVGQIDKNVAKAAGIAAGHIYLQPGNSKYGSLHLIKHEAELASNGYTILEFLTEVCRGFTKIKTSSHNNLILINEAMTLLKENRVGVAYVTLVRKANKYYSVQSCHIKNKVSFKANRVLWQRR